VYFDSDSPSDVACAERCLSDNRCQFWSYDTVANICILTEDCDNVDRTCDTCTSGPKTCSER